MGLIVKKYWYEGGAPAPAAPPSPPGPAGQRGTLPPSPETGTRRAVTPSPLPCTPRTEIFVRFQSKKNRTPQKASLQLPRALNGFVFVNRRGLPLSGCRVYDHWRQAAKRAGIKVTCHEGTRHSLASQAINRGVRERIVGDMLGHKCKASSKRYAKMRTETLKQVWEASPATVPRGKSDKPN